MTVRKLSCLLVFPLAACGGDAANAVRATVRDSAGIAIVENSAPAAGAARWHVSNSPIVDLGGGDTEEQQLFRVLGARRLSDGRIVVANAGTSELRFFDAEGRYWRSVGRKGDGPSEFQSGPFLIRAHDDSLLAYDVGNQRISVFTDSGRFVRSFVLQRIPDRFAQPVARFGDGTFLVFGGSMTPPPAGISRDTALFARYSATGALLDTVGLFGWAERYRRGDMGAGVPFNRLVPPAVHGNRVFVGENIKYEIAVYRHAGALQRLIRRSHTPVRVTSEDIARYKDEQVRTAVNEQHRRQIERGLSEVPFPDVLPPYARLHADEAGNLWVQEYQRPGDEQHRWSVFGPDGHLVAIVLTRFGLRVLQIGEDVLLGQIRDEDEVEHVVVYRLHKTEQRSSERGGGSAGER